MAKSGPRPTLRGSHSSTAKRDRVIDAAFQTLREEGFTHASARAVATRGGFNSGLIFYYFDSMNDLLVEALARSSRVQLAKYQDALADVTELTELIASVRARLRDDMASGHVKVLVELVGAGSSDERLRAAVFEQVEPWIKFTEQTLERVVGASELRGFVPADQLSFAVVSLFLGMELLVELSGGDGMVNGLLDSVQQLAGLVSVVLSNGGAR
jgi:DNA-binding transcriptional regulator YbjK